MADVKVGTGVLIERSDKILLGYRIASHGKDCWIMPGGHLEFGESFALCARRETKEETGLDVEPYEVYSVSNDVLYGKHYVTIGIKARYLGGEAQVMEPDKYREWKWFPLDDLPEPLSEYTRRALQNLKTGTVARLTQ
jgi:8-oxo-dGTP diphosphatase